MKHLLYDIALDVEEIAADNTDRNSVLTELAFGERGQIMNRRSK